MSDITTMFSGRELFTAACRQALRKESRVKVVDSLDLDRKAELATAVAKRRPRVLLIDIAHFPDARYALLTLLRRVSPKTRIILLCEHAVDDQIVAALSHGVMGYLEKKDINTFLAKSVLAVAAGEAWVPRRVTQLIAKRLVELSV